MQQQGHHPEQFRRQHQGGYDRRCRVPERQAIREIADRDRKIGDERNDCDWPDIMVVTKLRRFYRRSRTRAILRGTVNIMEHGLIPFGPR